MQAQKLGALITDLSERIDAVTDVAALRAREISELAYNAGEVKPQSLFFCIPGLRHDGHDFAAAAASAGAVALAVEHPVDVQLPQIRFANTRLALALISRDFFGDPSASLAITAVTGTNGKTTTTFLIDWICRVALSAGSGDQTGGGDQTGDGVHLGGPGAADGDQTGGDPQNSDPLKAATERTGLIGTVQTRVGTLRLPSKYTTPESYDLQRLLADMRDAKISHVCMEVSSHAIALHRVAGVQFAVAAFSNLTQDHLDFHKTMEDYFEAKASLFDSPLVARRVIDLDTAFGRRLKERCEKAGFEVVTCGRAADAQVRARDIHYKPNSTSLILETPAGDFPCTYPLIGGFNVSNVLLAASCASALGFSWPVIVSALAQAPQIPGRLERVWARGLAPEDERQAPVGVFVDYSHTPDSIKKALEALNEIKTARTLIVFGCGGDRDATKRPLMGAAALAADFAVVTSDNPRSEDPLRIIEDILPGMVGGEGRFVVECDRAAAIARALAAAEPGDLVLIAGKGHEDYQLIGDAVLDFDDRVVAAEALRALVDARHWPPRPAPAPDVAPSPGPSSAKPPVELPATPSSARLSEKVAEKGGTSCN